MGLSVKLNRALYLERSLPSRPFPRTMNKQQVAFYTHMKRKMYEKLGNFPMTTGGRCLFDSMGEALQNDRGVFSYALRDDEHLFVDAMVGILDDMDESELGAHWFVNVLGDVTNPSLCGSQVQSVYVDACKQATDDYISLMEESLDVISYHWSSNDKKECIQSMRDAYRYNDMVLYALDRITEHTYSHG